MRIVNFKKNGVATLGVRRDGDVVDLSVADKSLPRDLAGLLAAGKGAMNKAARAARQAPKRAVIKAPRTFLPPIETPGKIICVGLNYSDHAAEAGLKPPDYPILFLRVPSSVVGHGQAIIRPKASKHFDYECEMVVVIGRRGRNITKSKALDHVAGYSVANEGSIRDYQMRSSQWTLGKNFDKSGAWGPDFVTADELPKGGKGLKIETRLNGRVLQSSSTANMIFDTQTLVSVASKVMTLEPGDIILTGTPHGVGFVRKPPVFMKAGDTCEIEIEGIGLLRNPVRAEK
ncbi:MAG: fumarylacetoacetate hydrolase family protein [Rhodospirillales bacterium]|jgi:2-keto-4-pentenoate hydratase/2-oxohepta-3-ene-1,7-dioic acid hydratase in catechol pathway|nr:fumarylacetoacetate hydrolase family protein [Rhodospirillales bacterium]